MASKINALDFNCELATDSSTEKNSQFAKQFHFTVIGDNFNCYVLSHSDNKKGRTPRTPRKVSNLETVPEQISRSPSSPEDQNLFTFVKPKHQPNKDIIGKHWTQQNSWQRLHVCNVCSSEPNKIPGNVCSVCNVCSSEPNKIPGNICNVCNAFTIKLAQLYPSTEYRVLESIVELNIFVQTTLRSGIL